MDLNLEPAPLPRPGREIDEEAGVFLIGTALVMLLAACGPQELTGFVRDPLPYVGNLSLPEASAGGADFSFVAPEGEFLLVYFGYTACPDVCPTTMSDLRTAVRDLGDDGDRIQVAMATVDPDRDYDELITNYVRAFFDDGHALRTEDPDELAEVAEVFAAAYSVTENDNGDVEVTHSAFTYVIDDQGELIVTWPFGQTADDMAADMKLLLKDT